MALNKPNPKEFLRGLSAGKGMVQIEADALRRVIAEAIAEELERLAHGSALEIQKTPREFLLMRARLLRNGLR